MLLSFTTLSTPSLSFNVSGMDVTLDSTRFTIASLTDSTAFDFVPPQNFTGSHRLGDVTLRVRRGDAPYATMTTAGDAGAVALPASAGQLARINLTDSLHGAAGIQLERRFARAASGGLTMSFELTNTGTDALEVGGWGAAMVLMTMSVGGQKTLDQMAASCTMVDPAIIGEGGFVSATRMTGGGPVLLVVPERGAGVQSWRRMREASGGEFYELTSHSTAYAAAEWMGSGTPFVPPTSIRVPGGGSATVGYRLLLAPSVRAKDDALAAAGFGVC